MGLVAKPSWANRADIWVNQGEKFAPVTPLPDGRILAPVQKRTDTTPDSIVGRLGVVGVMNYQSEARYLHDFRHVVDIKNNHVADKNPGGWRNWTRTEMRNAASASPIVPVEGNDFGESSFGYPAGSNQDKWYFERRMEMFADPSINTLGLRRRDYGQHGCDIGIQGTNAKWNNADGTTTRPNDPFFKNRFSSVAAARSGVGYFNTSVRSFDNSRDIPYEELVGYNVKWYAEYPDYARNHYSKNYAIRVMGKGMGKVGGLGPGFLMFNYWGKIEGLGEAFTASVNNGIFMHRRLDNGSSSGTVISGVHPQPDYEFMVGTCLINGLLYSDGISTFDTANRFGVDPKRMDSLNTPGSPGNDKTDAVYWEPDVPGTPAPAEPGGYPYEPNQWQDAPYEAAHFYKTFGRTEGVGWQSAPYRFEGSDTWIEPTQDGSQILEDASAFDNVNAVGQNVRRGRPTADYRYKNSALDLVTFDPSRGRAYSERIFVRGPNGQQYPSLLRGGIVNVHNETINA